MTNHSKALENGTTLDSCPCKQFQKKYTCDHVAALRRFKEEHKNILLLIRVGLDPDAETYVFKAALYALVELGIRRKHLKILMPSKHETRHNPSSRPVSTGAQLPYFVTEEYKNA